MINQNHRLKWLLDRLSALNDDMETVKAEIDATSDVLQEKKLEKRLNIIFGQIEHFKNQIQQENNNLNNKLTQKKFDDLIQIIQSNQILSEQIQQAYQKTLLHWPARVKNNLDDVRSIVTELNKIPQGR
jgi:thymidylate synthase